MELLTNPIVLTIISVLVLVYSAILHEIAHGYVADRLGDPTARLLGRLTLNPIKHIDPYFTILIPLMLFMFHSPVLFGGAKPVPIDPFNFREGRKDVALVSLAGPLTNILLAVFAAALIKLFHLDVQSANTTLLFISIVLINVLHINILLAIFNLIPIPPLDGSKIFALILPEEAAQQYLSISQFGMVLLFILLFLPAGPLSLETLIGNLYNYALTLLGF